MIVDRIRDKKEFINLYNSVNNSNLPPVESLLSMKDYIYCFYDDCLLGCIYLEGKDGKIFLSGFSKPKQFDKVIEAIKHICNSYNEDIYADTPFRSARIALIRCGFKKITDTILKRSKQNGRRKST